MNVKRLIANFYISVYGEASYMKILWKYKNCYTYLKSILVKYKYKPEKYIDTFLSITSDSDDASVKTSVPRVIYMFWTGENEMSENRKRSLDSVIKKSGVEVKLITPENVKEYILKEFPLHPAYNYLSYVHRSDYLRSYFMNYYGGGYVDIKSITKSWINAFKKLNDSDAYLVGYPELNIQGVAIYGQNNINIKLDLYNNWRLLVGTNSYICRPRTKFTEEWLAEINRRLDLYLPLLEMYPSNEDPYKNENTDYPIYWTEICGSIFHPLCLKYNNRIIKDKTIKPVLKDYR